MQFIFPAAVCLVLLIAAIFFARKAKAESQQVADLTKELADKTQQNAVFTSQIESANARLLESNSERDSLRSELTAARDSFAKLQGRAEANGEAQTLLTGVFKTAAEAALKSNSETFLGLAEGKLATKKAEIDGLIAPMTVSLTSLNEKVTSLKQSEDGLLLETRELASALKESRVRGVWGQLQLQRIAELSGMQERCDFELQKYVSTEDNRRLFPDMIVHLPNNRVVVVDSKASMEAYRLSTLATDENVRQQKLAEHAKAVRARVDELSAKEYRAHVAGSADFVICFIPGEAFFSAALAVDDGLIEYAAAKSVILASPTTLLTILKAVALGWKEAKLAEDAKEMCKLSLDLYERFRVTADHIDNLGGGLRNAINAYNKFLGSAESRVFPQARKLQKLTHSEKELAPIAPIEIASRTVDASDWVLQPGIVGALAADLGTSDEDSSLPVGESTAK